MFSDRITKLVAEDVKKITAGTVKQSAKKGAMVNSGTPEPVSPPKVQPTASSNDVLVMGGQGRGNITTGDVDRASAAMGKAAKTPAKAMGRVGRMVAQGVTRIFKGRGS